MFANMWIKLWDKSTEEQFLRTETKEMSFGTFSLELKELFNMYLFKISSTHLQTDLCSSQCTSLICQPV